MKTYSKNRLAGAIALTLLGFVGTAGAVVNIQCPGDTDGDSVIDTPDPNHPNAKCMHLTSGDSFSMMSDGNPMYMFGYGNRTSVQADNVISEGILASEWPGPTIELDQGDEFFLNLSNVGTVMRPDLFDPHTVHFHGFPNAATVFDGVPEVSISINMGSTLTYYYNIVHPGTYIYHCHVEATEHMEMGMLANLYVHPAQDMTGCVDENGVSTGACPISLRGGNAGGPGGYAYNDGDGTTAWDVEKALQFSSFDSYFHDQHIKVQPLPFERLQGDYPMINGRGYPDTINPAELPAPADNTLAVADNPPGKITGTPGELLTNGKTTQKINSVISVEQGQRLLLRLSNVGLDRFWTITAMGLKMKIVGTGAKLMRGATGKNLYRETASVNFGGGETTDVIIDTTGVAPGTYFLHATEVHQMSNVSQLDGGMITEIVVN